MNSYSLIIADYVIRFERGENGPDLIPSQRFAKFICDREGQDILIRVHGGKQLLPRRAEMVFNAPYVEEVDGTPVKKRERFWSIHRDENKLFIKTIFPLSSFKKRAILKFSLDSTTWDLWIDGDSTSADPMEYPLDGLILYYLSVISGDIMIHASGVSYSGKGYIFSGVSGKGKSTMARLWDQSGAKVIHDDRLIIRRNGNGYGMFNTPVYNDEMPSSAALDRIFLIEHGRKNEMIPVAGAAGVSLVMANCIQHNWNPHIVAKLLGSVSEMCSGIPVARLSFLPDRSIIEYLIENE